MSNRVYSWGRYPNQAQIAHEVFWRDQVSAAHNNVLKSELTSLAYGNGRSYGDSCLAQSGHVVHTKLLNRFITTDWENGIITAEAGVTLQDILRISISNGWFLAVTPGTQFVTLGGAVANDVHGKNHHVRGTFGNHVRQFGLYRNGEDIVCSSESNQDIYQATIGGLGLTGIITWVEIQLIPVNNGQIDSISQRFTNLNEFFQLSEELDKQHEYSVAWVDCLANGDNTGRGAFFVGDHAEYSEPQQSSSRKLTVPLTPPISFINNLSLRSFNELYYYKQPKTPHWERVDYEPFFYPLDAILHWNRIYGKPGFQQFQCVIPDHSAKDAIYSLLAEISKSGQGSFLAVLKRCGDIESPGLLSFPFKGASLALDFPNRNGLEALFNRLDQIVSEAGGRLYPAKDAHMKAKHFQAAYPEWEKLEKLRDKSLMSQFWKRVTQ